MSGLHLTTISRVDGGLAMYFVFLPILGPICTLLSYLVGIVSQDASSKY